MTQNQFAKLLKQPKKDRPVLDFAMTTGEVMADVATKGEVFALVPGVNWAFKALKAKDAIADAIYAKKLVEFINGIGEFSDDERAKAAAQFEKAGATKAGETVLLVLDRITDLDKPALLGFLFRCFATGKLTAQQLRRLCVAVDFGFADDLLDLLDPDAKLSKEEVQDCRRRLVPTGLTSLHIASGFGVGGESSHHYTRIGVLFFKLINGTDPVDEIPYDAPRVAG
jgi:hypothetical protein